MRHLFKSALPAFILITYVLTGCGLAADNKQAREAGGKFYDALKTGDVATAASFCATDETMTTQAWQNLFTQNLNMMGKVKSYDTGSGFNVSTSNGVSVVRIGYNVDYEYGSSFDSLILQSSGDDFKIIQYSPVIKTAKFQEEMAKAKTLVSNYMQALQAGDYDKAYSFVGYSGTTMHTKDEWFTFFKYVDDNAGRLSGYEINENGTSVYINDKHSEAGDGNIYAISVFTQHPSGSATSQIDVFQPKFNDELKIVAHNVE